MGAPRRQQRALRDALRWNAEIEYPTTRANRPPRLHRQISLQKLLIGVSLLSAWLAVWRHVGDHRTSDIMLAALLPSILTLALVRSATGWPWLRWWVKPFIGLFVYLAYLAAFDSIWPYWYFG